MGNLVFPALPGVQLGRKKTPNWATLVQATATMREVRIALASSPVYDFELPYEFLRTLYRYRELQSLMSFYNQVQGSWDSWLYDDPTDDFAWNVQIGTGDGVTTSFQLVRPYGSFSENVANPNVATVSTDPLMWAQDLSTPMWSATPATTPMWLQGAGLGPFTISNPGGLLTFSYPPPAGVPVYWSGFFYYRCRFASDSTDFQQEMSTFYSHGGLQFRGSLGTKI